MCIYIYLYGLLLVELAASTESTAICLSEVAVRRRRSCGVKYDCSGLSFNQGVVKEAKFYICFGRLIALALIHEIQIGITLDRILFVQLANDDLILEDIAETSPYLYKSYNDILMCSPSKFHKMPLYLDEGDDVEVKFEEREQFVLQKIQAEFVDSIQTQTEHIIQGFDDIISSPNRTEFFQIIKLNDLDIMIRGLSDLCVEDWMNNNTYEGGFSNLDPEIDWFWECVTFVAGKK